MIVRGRPSLRDVMFATRGSILPRILPTMAGMAAASVVAVTVMDHAHPGMLAGLAAMPFTLIGLSLSIFMSFRNTACYDRWWEGRKLWGQLVIAARSLARQSATLSPADREGLLLPVCAFAAGLAARLREEDEPAAIGPHLAPGPWLRAPNPTDAALAEAGRQVQMLAAAGRIDPMRATVLEGTLTELAHVQGGCERIKTTPIPFSYSLLLHRTAYVFCGLLPFALAPALGWWTPVPTLLVSYAFFGLDTLGDQLGDPFGTDENDLPLDAMVRLVERELLFALGRTELPPPLLPDNYVLM